MTIGTAPDYVTPLYARRLMSKMPTGKSLDDGIVVVGVANKVTTWLVARVQWRTDDNAERRDRRSCTEMLHLETNQRSKGVQVPRG